MLVVEAERNGLTHILSEEDFNVFTESGTTYQDFKKELSKIKRNNPLPSTKVASLDWLLSFYSFTAAKSNIAFDVKINGDIAFMLDNIIDRAKLETIIADHIQDAFNAVKQGSNPLRSIMVVIGQNDDFHELAFHDSGVEFDIKTLMALGTTRITTHADEGGSGIGFMSTFGIMRESNASLIIREEPLSDSGYTKSVTIRFDGLGKYIIETYRKKLYPRWQRREIDIVSL